MKLNTFNPHSLKTRVTLLTLAIFVIGIWSLALYIGHTLRQDMQRSLGERQFSTASIVAAQINDELVYRFGGLEDIAAEVTPATMANPASLQTLLEQHSYVHSMFNGGILAFNRDGIAVGDVPRTAQRIGLNYGGDEWILAALKQGKSTVGRPIMGKVLHSPVFTMTVPIRDPQGQVIGALSGVVNLGKPNFLDKITQGRYGETGGYVLVAVQQRQIVTATDKSRIMQSLSPPGVIPQTDRFIQGFEGYAVYVNPLGQEVLNSSKRVPAAGWNLAVTMPAAEAFAPIRAMQQHILLATIVLTLLAGTLMWWLVRRQLAPMLSTVKTLATLAQSDQNPQPLPITRQDEIGELISGFNRLLLTLAQREETLRESEARLRDITFSIADWVWEVDENGVYTYSSQKGFDFFGQSREDVIGKTPFDFMPPDEARRVAAIFSEIAANRAPIKDLENWNIGKSGQNICLLTNGVPILDEAGNFKGYRGVDKDITARKQATQELEARDAYLTAIIENQPGLIWLKDVKGRFLAINHAFAASCGREIQEVLGKTDLDIWPREMAEKYVADDAKVMQAGRPIAVEELIQDENEPKWFETFKTPIRDSHDNIIGSTGYARDITERKQAEEKIRQYVEQLQSAFMSTVEVATTLSELRDPYTAGHERRVGKIAAAIGTELGLDAQRIEGLRVAGYLHDIGKINIPAEILSKPGQLSEIEFKLIQGHAQAGYEVLKNVQFPWPVAQAALQHHERIDGSGYPQGLKGDAILLEARILSVADVVEAMSSYRPYRPSLGIDKALAEIERGRGSAYDTTVVDACLKLFREKGYAIES